MGKQIFNSILQIFYSLWSHNPILCTVAILILILTPITRLPSVKGWIGEMIMRFSFKLFLPKKVYRVANNVTIPDGQGGTTQIDHIIVSPYGVFVVETKHYKGWIFGGEHDRQWTQKIHKNHSQRFQNPLHQNYKHTECLSELLDLSNEQIKSVIVFTGECTLKTRDKLPAHVTYPSSCVGYIKRHKDIILESEDVTAIETAIQENRLTPGWRTAQQHNAYVESLHPEQKTVAVVKELVASYDDPFSAEEPLSAEEPQTFMPCPRCEAEMVLRTAKRGANAGKQFWGCSNYPKCREVKQTD